MTEIVAKPFDWNDNLSEEAIEDFNAISDTLSYGVASTIGTALAKLKWLEEQGCKVKCKWERGGHCCGETEWICQKCNASEWRTNRVPFCPWCGNPMEVE